MIMVDRSTFPLPTNNKVRYFMNMQTGGYIAREDTGLLKWQYLATENNCQPVFIHASREGQLTVLSSEH